MNACIHNTCMSVITHSPARFTAESDVEITCMTRMQMTLKRRGEQSLPDAFNAVSMQDSLYTLNPAAESMHIEFLQ